MDFAPKPNRIVINLWWQLGNSVSLEIGDPKLLYLVSADSSEKCLVFRIWFGFSLVLLRDHVPAIQIAGYDAEFEG